VCHKEEEEKKKQGREKKELERKKRKSGTFLSPETMIRACFTRKSSSPVSVQSLSPHLPLHLLLDSSSSHFFFFFLSHTYDNTCKEYYYYKFLLIIGTYTYRKKHNPFLLRESYRVMKIS